MRLASLAWHGSETTPLSPPSKDGRSTGSTATSPPLASARGNLKLVKSKITARQEPHRTTGRTVQCGGVMGRTCRQRCPRVTCVWAALVS